MGRKKSPMTRFGHPILEGWDEIAEYMGKAVSTAQVYAARKVDPLPVQKGTIGRHVWIFVADLRSWAIRQGWSVSPVSPSDTQ